MLRDRARLYAGKPPEDDALLLCVRAWQDLETCRSVGMAVGPIPWTAVQEWALASGLDRDSTRLLHDVIRYVDGERARIERAKQNLKNATGGTR